MKEEALRMERVTYTEKGVTLLDNFNFQIFSGEIMGAGSSRLTGA